MLLSVKLYQNVMDLTLFTWLLQCGRVSRNSSRTLFFIKHKFVSCRLWDDLCLDPAPLWEIPKGSFLLTSSHSLHFTWEELCHLFFHLLLWMRNVPHKLLNLYTWSPVGKTAGRYYGTFRGGGLEKVGWLWEHIALPQFLHSLFSKSSWDMSSLFLSSAAMASQILWTSCPLEP